MNAINILFAITLLYSLTANFSAAKKGFKEKLTKAVYKPKTYLQKLPPNISALVLLLQIIGIFNIGVLNSFLVEDYLEYRIAALIFYAAFSYLQIKSFRNLGKYYSQDIVIIQQHELVTTGLHRKIRHPQYLFQLLSDLFAGITLASFLVLPVVIFLEIPLFILRAKREDEMMMNHFKDSFAEYKSKSGFFLPIGRK